MPEAVLGLGSNLGARRALLHAATELLRGQPGLQLLARSPLYATPALGPPQPDYLNAAVRVRWPGSAQSLFRATQHVEQLLGRERLVRWGARTIDIDLLFWSEGPVHSEALVIPHPELTQRNFALGPLLDVMPELSSTFCSRAEPRASTYGARLQALGGLPPRATPGWLELPLDSGGRDTRIELETEGAELACLIVGAVSACAPKKLFPDSTLPFRVPAALFDARGHCLLLARGRAAARSGFRVDCAAITEHTEAEARGFLIGTHTGEPNATPALEPWVRALSPTSYEVSVGPP